ncbi:hypothetical protein CAUPRSCDRAFT_10349 [Caulochytrium protostelioides]|uniref:Uncharacterized protein n=1 Tax=Caulochytrium protostelioides TaxID=1555241 RepID=A0A4P9WXA7_9FUNG|nr:hypothetical protein CAUPRSCDRAFT_10349 [Caulochytrium protostelioides]
MAAWTPCLQAILDALRAAPPRAFTGEGDEGTGVSEPYTNAIQAVFMILVDMGRHQILVSDDALRLCATMASTMMAAHRTNAVFVAMLRGVLLDLLRVQMKSDLYTQYNSVRFFETMVLAMIHQCTVPAHDWWAWLLQTSSHSPVSPLVWEAALAHGDQLHAPENDAAPPIVSLTRIPTAADAVLTISTRYCEELVEPLRHLESTNARKPQFADLEPSLHDRNVALMNVYRAQTEDAVIACYGHFLVTAATDSGCTAPTFTAVWNRYVASTLPLDGGLVARLIRVATERHDLPALLFWSQSADAFADPALGRLVHATLVEWGLVNYTIKADQDQRQDRHLLEAAAKQMICLGLDPSPVARWLFDMTAWQRPVATEDLTSAPAEALMSSQAMAAFWETCHVLLSLDDSPTTAAWTRMMLHRAPRHIALWVHYLNDVASHSFRYDAARTRHLQAVLHRQAGATLSVLHAEPLFLSPLGVQTTVIECIDHLEHSLGRTVRTTAAATGTAPAVSATPKPKGAKRKRLHSAGSHAGALVYRLQSPPGVASYEASSPSSSVALPSSWQDCSEAEAAVWSALSQAASLRVMLNVTVHWLNHVGPQLGLTTSSSIGTSAGAMGEKRSRSLRLLDAVARRLAVLLDRQTKSRTPTWTLDKEMLHHLERADAIWSLHPRHALAMLVQHVASSHPLTALLALMALSEAWGSMWPQYHDALLYRSDTFATTIGILMRQGHLRVAIGVLRLWLPPMPGLMSGPQTSSPLSGILAAPTSPDVRAWQSALDHITLSPAGWLCLLEVVSRSARSQAHTDALLGHQHLSRRALHIDEGDTTGHLLAVHPAWLADSLLRRPSVPIDEGHATDSNGWDRTAAPEAIRHAPWQLVLIRHLVATYPTAVLRHGGAFHHVQRQRPDLLQQLDLRGQRGAVGMWHDHGAVSGWLVTVMDVFFLMQAQAPPQPSASSSPPPPTQLRYHLQALWDDAETWSTTGGAPSPPLMQPIRQTHTISDNAFRAWLMLLYRLLSESEPVASPMRMYEPGFTRDQQASSMHTLRTTFVHALERHGDTHREMSASFSFMCFGLVDLQCSMAF